MCIFYVVELSVAPMGSVLSSLAVVVANQSYVTLPPVKPCDLVCAVCPPSPGVVAFADLKSYPKCCFQPPLFLKVEVKMVFTVVEGKCWHSLSLLCAMNFRPREDQEQFWKHPDHLLFTS